MIKIYFFASNNHVPSYTLIYIFCSWKSGAIFFENRNNVIDYINKSVITKFSSQESIFIVSPNGETRKVYANGLRQYIAQDIDVYPGSVIYVPRHIGKIEGVNFYATVAPIFSSLALSVASLNSIND